jgi:hypothetical protein
VTTLNSNSANIVTLASGATEVAQNSLGLGESLVAYRPVSGGHTTVGVTAYVGANAAQSGDWGKVIVNAGNWLIAREEVRLQRLQLVRRRVQHPQERLAAHRYG